MAVMGSEQNFEQAETNEFRESGKIPIEGLRVYRKGHATTIPARFIRANDSFKFDPMTRTLTLELLADGVEVVERERR